MPTQVKSKKILNIAQILEQKILIQTNINKRIQNTCKIVCKIKCLK